MGDWLGQRVENSAPSHMPQQAKSQFAKKFEGGA